MRTLAALALSVGLAGVAPAQPPAAAGPDWVYAHDLRVRKGGAAEVTADTPKLGVECFKDAGSGKLLYAAQSGGVAFAAAPPAISADRAPDWHHAVVLKVRGPDETAFGPASKRVAVECFKDGNTGGLVYVTDAGRIAATPAPAAPPTEVKPPVALYGFAVKVRQAGEATTTDKSKLVGVEVFRDPNAGGLIYVTDAGYIAAAPAPADLATTKGTAWRRGFTLAARPGGTAAFDAAAKVGVEVYTDENTGYAVYVTDAGAVAVGSTR